MVEQAESARRRRDTPRPPSHLVEVVIPRSTKPEFKELGGSDSDHFNQMLANQTLGALWVAHSDDEQRNRQFLAASADLLHFADYSGEQLLGQLGALDPAWQDRLVRRAAPVAGPAVAYQGGLEKGPHIPIKYSYRNLGTLSGHPVLGLAGCGPQAGMRPRQLGSGQRQHAPAGDDCLLHLAGNDGIPGREPVDRQGRRQVGQQEHTRRRGPMHQAQTPHHLLDFAFADLLDESLRHP